MLSRTPIAKSILRIFAPLLIAVIVLAESVVAGDWPQILGPNRDGQAVDEQVVAWTGTPEVLWKTPCGAGYAGVAVAAGRVYLFHRQDDQEVLECLTAAEGKRLWRATFDAYYQAGVDPDAGPRCVPVVDSGVVILHGAGGDVYAVAAEDGRTLWSRSPRGDYGADDGYFGAGSTPLVVSTSAGKLVVVEVGGRRGAGLVAMDFATGETRWKTLDSEAAYAAPVMITLDGEPFIAALMRLSLAIVEPASGRVHLEVPFGKRGPTVTAATPLVDGNQIFVTASYGLGCEKWSIDNQQATSLWSTKDVISSQYVTPVRVGDYLYAITGREDMGVPGLCCVSWKDGRQAWSNAGFGTAHFIAAGDKILAQRVDGQLDLLAANPQQFESLASSPLPPGTYRSLPALASGILYVKRATSPKAGEVLAIRVGR